MEHPRTNNGDKTMTTRKAILYTATQAVMFDRNKTHGKPEQTFGLTASLWSALLDKEVSPAQVALMLSALKIARAWGNPGHEDNWVDLAGYAACGGELAAEQKKGRDLSWPQKKKGDVK
jgi:hypothetical protein